MNYYEEVKLPRFNKDSFYRELIKLVPLMQDRTSKAKGWKSLDLKLDNKNKRILTTCTVVEEWINKISFSTVYVAILEPKGYIDWQ